MHDTVRYCAIRASYLVYENLPVMGLCFEDTQSAYRGFVCFINVVCLVFLYLECDKTSRLSWHLGLNETKGTRALKLAPSTGLGFLWPEADTSLTAKGKDRTHVF